MERDRPPPAGARLRRPRPAAGRKKRGCPSEEKEYGALRAVWPRPWEDDDAADRQAFTAALQVASASVIIAGAKERVKAVAERNEDKGPDWVSFPADAGEIPEGARLGEVESPESFARFGAP